MSILRSALLMAFVPSVALAGVCDVGPGKNEFDAAAKLGMGLMVIAVPQFHKVFALSTASQKVLRFSHLCCTE